MSDPEFILFFLNSWVHKFLRVAKGFRLASTNSGGAMEQEASAFVDIVFRCNDISVLYCVLSCITRQVSITV